MTKTSKESSQVVEICEKISKGSIYLLVFLLPLFFLPWTANVLDFNKQALLIVLVSISIFAWLLKILILGKFRFNLNWIHIPIAVLFLVLSVSTIFSLWSYGSFWGWPQITSESLFTLLSLVLLYFLITSAFEKKEIFYLMTSLIFSGFLVALLGIFQLFGKFLFPFDFTKTTSFNTIGSVNSLAIFAAVLLPLTIILTTRAKGFLKAFFVIALILGTVLLVLINFSIAWWLVLVGAALVITLGIQKRDFFDIRWLTLPMFFLVLALFFTFFRFQISGMPSRVIGVFLNQRTSFGIAQEVLRENPVLGSGPGTFVYDFSKYKEIDFNQSPFWSLRFERASSKILNTLATTGILGILSFLALISFFIFYGVKSLFGNLKKEKSDKKEVSLPDKTKEGSVLSKKALEQAKGSPTPKFGGEGQTDKGFLWILSVGIFISLIILTIGYFFYQSNLSLNFIYFLLLAGFISLVFPLRKEFLLKSSSLTTLGVTFVFTLVFIFGLGIFILEGQRYIAEASYLKGVKAWRQGNSQESILYLEKANRINSKVDLYWRELSQVYIQRINEVVQRTDLSREEINSQVQILIKKSVDSVKIATELNPKNVANWSVRGFVYQNLIGIINGAEDWTKKSYEEALELEPTNPYFPTKIGIAFLREASFLSKEQQEEKEKILGEAKGQFEKAIELKSDYAPARFQIAMVYQAQGKQSEAIQELERTRSIAPNDVGLAFQLGLIYYQSKDYQKAQAEFERAIFLNSNYSNALYFLGLTYDQLGQNSKAIEKFRKVAELNPDNLEIQKILENLRTGREALEGIIEEEPPKVPIEETPSE